ncbi:MAG: peptidylprolyl isomerase [Tissierellia bacterium]|nr:peptidylprolyl isomerase [Tissierellia bacterium]
MSEKKIVAVVNGKEIFEQDVLKFLNDMGPQMAMQFQSEEGIQRVVDELVNQELLYLDAVDSKMSEEADYEELLELAKVNLLKNYAFNKLVGKETVSEEEIEKFYNDYKENFQRPEMLNASHILVDSEEKANDIVEEIKNGLSFEDAAMKYSSCPSKEQGGNLGEFGKGQMVPEFENAAFDMDEGEISGPVKSQFGYHIIKLNEKLPESLSTMEEVHEEIKNQIVRMKQQDKYMNKVNELTEKYKVERF